MSQNTVYSENKLTPANFEQKAKSGQKMKFSEIKINEVTVNCVNNLHREKWKTAKRFNTAHYQDPTSTNTTISQSTIGRRRHERGLKVYRRNSAFAPSATFSNFVHRS